MPKSPARYTPGSTVTTLPGASGAPLRGESSGSSWMSIPTPCPKLWPILPAKPYSASTCSASSCASLPVMPGRSTASTCSFASRMAAYPARSRSDGSPRNTVRVMSEQYPCARAPKSITTHCPASSFVAPGTEWGLAPFAPHATIEGNAKPSAPWRTMNSSSSICTSRSVMPGFIKVMIWENAASVMA